MSQNHAFIHMNDSFVDYKILGLFSFSLESTTILSYFSHPVLLLKNLICVPSYSFFCFVLEAFYICYFFVLAFLLGDFFKLAYQLASFSSDVSVLIFIFCILTYYVINFSYYDIDPEFLLGSFNIFLFLFCVGRIEYSSLLLHVLIVLGPH